ncbi:MAG TPA: DUF3617 domain-containing protein [Terriglobales bacterium]|nr:DUF3617 domain-containing protein [Terriglobales bacterium]
MKKWIWMGVGMACAASLWAADKIQPLNVKLGLWETTVVTETSGTPPIPPDMLAKMTPEQKARMEAMIKQRQGEGPKTQTIKKCVTKEDMDKPDFMGKDDPQCTKTVVTSTSRKLEGKMECTHGGGKQSGTFLIEASDPSNVKGETHMVMSGNGNTMTANAHFTSKWVGANCGDVK